MDKSASEGTTLMGGNEVLPSWAEENESFGGVDRLLSNDASFRDDDGDVLEGRERSIVVGEMTESQEVACFASLIGVLVAVAMVSVWVSEEAMGGGGVSWTDGDSGRVFNWHPVLMVTAFSFMTVASLSFRVRKIQSRNGTTSRATRKVLHGVSWTVAMICGGIGVSAAVKSHNDGQSGYIANLYSLHSWVGCGVILLYVIQFLSANLTFVWKPQCLNSAMSARFLNFHRYMGTYIYIIAAATILLGIQEKEGFIGCSYNVTKPDYRPWENYLRIPHACRIGSFLGLVVLLLSLCTSYALYNFPESQQVKRGSMRLE